MEGVIALIVLGSYISVYWFFSEGIKHDHVFRLMYISISSFFSLMFFLLLDEKVGLPYVGFFYSVMFVYLLREKFRRYN